MLLMMKLAGRIEVAKSFAKIAAGAVTMSALETTARLRAVAQETIVDYIQNDEAMKARVGRAMKVAEAAALAAVHVATHRAASRPAPTGSTSGADAEISSSMPVENNDHEQ